jgi:hypothetical protein
MADDPAQVAQELERARSLAQRGTLLAGANTVTVAVLLQSLATLISPGLATHAGAKFMLLIALLCFVGAAISAATSIGAAATSPGALATARTANATSARRSELGIGFDVVGMVFLALTAVLFFF